MCQKQLRKKQAGTRPRGRCDMEPSQIITDYRLSQTQHFRWRYE